MTLTSETLAELERLESAATPGPWTVGYVRGQCHLKHTHDGSPSMGGTCRYDYEIVAGGSEIVAPPNVTVCMSNDWGPGMAKKDQEFVAYLRNAAPALFANCRQVEELKALVRKSVAFIRREAEDVERDSETEVAIILQARRLGCGEDGK